MDLDDSQMYEEYPLPPTGNLAGIPNDWSMPWLREDVVPTESIPAHCMPCNKTFDKWLWRHSNGIVCRNKRDCWYAHGIKELQPPTFSDPWVPCQELPPGSPANHCFVAVDWGSGHADSPVLHFNLSDTYPCKPARWLRSLSQQGELARKRAVKEHAEGVWSKLCYTYTLFEKCSRWQNCDFLHVTPEARKREFTKYFCKCAKVGTQATRCKRTKCPYVHYVKDLSVPCAFLTPRFPKASEICTITWEVLHPTTKAVELKSTSIGLKYIAATDASLDERQLCQNPYCNSERCTQGLHLLPTAWVQSGVAFGGGFGPQPPMPACLVKYLREANQRAVRAAGPTRAPWYSALSSSKLGSPGVPNGCVLQVQSGSAGVASRSTVDDDGISCGFESVAEQDAALASYPGSQSSQSSSEDSVAGTVLITDQAVGIGSEAALCQSFLALLDMGPPANPNRRDPTKPPEPLRFKEKNHSRLTDQEFTKLSKNWNTGSSRRYRALYKDWLDSKQMQKTYLKDGGVLTHSSLTITNGSIPKIQLGIMQSDGREVALMIFNDEPEAESHLVPEVIGLKNHSMIPGTVQYLTSFVWRHDREEEGDTAFRKIVVLELMEGNLVDVMANWGDTCLGTPDHLQLARFVTGSLLVILKELNHGEQECLVHRDVQPENIMVDAKKQIRILDFGTSRDLKKNLVYASPEERHDRPFAHLTSNLYSLGMVLRAILTRKYNCDFPAWTDAEGAAKNQNEVPGWPEFHRQSCLDFITSLLTLNPDKRAYGEVLLKTPHLKPHELMLSHPFFWSARKCVHFLVALGNYNDIPNPDLETAIRESYEPHMSWFNLVQEKYEQKSHPTSDYDKRRSFGLLRFIRNKYIHASELTPRSLSRDAVEALLARPVFLEMFPGLVVRCWTALLRMLPTVFTTYNTLQDYFNQPFSPDMEKRIFDTEAWL